MPVRLVSHEEPLPGYRLIERLGRGGFGEVWKVEAPGGLLKAMKFVFGDLDAADEDSRPAEQELKALKRVQAIRHPYVLSLERYDILEGQLIITMELADENLWDRYRKCRSQGLTGIPRDELLRFMEEAAEALDLMNNHYQIQHLDVKPQNLFVVFNHVKVGDFGLAKLLEGVRATVTGGVTPVYAAPETFEGYVSRFSDQYSLAIVFQELLTGTRPFTGSNTRQLLMQHINGTPDMQKLSSGDQAIIGRALSKKPDDRWPTCSEMVRALKLSGLPAVQPAQSPALGGSGRLGVSTADSTAGESALATRVQVGGSGRLGGDPSGSNPSGSNPSETPQPGSSLSGANSSRIMGRTGSGSTPMPPLVTVGPGGQIVPRLVTQSPNATPSPSVTQQRPMVFQTGRMSSLGIAPPERNGDGVLFPAIVVAVGHLGRIVVEHFRKIVRERYGSLEKIPNIRFLYLDTDPELGELQSASSSSPSGFLPREIVYARLNRSVHYLQRENLPPIEQWLPPGVLYKLPRSPGAANGIRAFGRLALLDNYRLVAQRIRQEVETFLTDEPLMKADQTTQFGLRTNRPRAYIVTGLGGGTGGGMFLDLAYLIRHELRSVGYIRPETVGMFLVPPADKTASRNSSLGNVFAALTELNHFQSRGTRYQTTFDKSEAPIVDSDPPFARVALLQLPKSVDTKERLELTNRIARSLFNEILTPSGRVTDEVRDVYRNAFPSANPTCQSFGLFRLTWPRPELLASATTRFAQRLIQSWTGKDVTGIRDSISKWLDGLWEERKLGFEAVLEVFENAARDALHEEPERVFDAFVEPLRSRTPSAAKLDAAGACSVLEQLIKLIGKPPSSDDQSEGTLQKSLAVRFQEVTKEAEGQLADTAVAFIEQPKYRLAGAEEAVRQIGDRLKRQIDALDPVYKDLEKDVRVAYTKTLQAIGGLTGGIGWKGATAEAIELLRAYPRRRLQLQLLELCLSTYRKMLGTTPEYLREIGNCRAGLGDIHNLIGLKTGPVVDPAGSGKMILPDQCKTLDDAADRFLAGINPDDILAFDQSIQKETVRKFRGLSAVCLKPVEKGPPFVELLLNRAREFLDKKLDSADPATVFFRNRPGNRDDHPLIGEAYDEAKPDIEPLGGERPDEATILAIPPGNDGERFRKLVAEALPSVEFTTAPLPDDITFYREYPRLELQNLPHLGEFAREASQNMIAKDHPPHARVDINW